MWCRVRMRTIVPIARLERPSSARCTAITGCLAPAASALGMGGDFGAVRVLPGFGVETRASRLAASPALPMLYFVATCCIAALCGLRPEGDLQHEFLGELGMNSGCAFRTSPLQW